MEPKKYALQDIPHHIVMYVNRYDIPPIVGVRTKSLYTLDPDLVGTHVRDQQGVSMIGAYLAGINKLPTESKGSMSYTKKNHCRKYTNVPLSFLEWAYSLLNTTKATINMYITWDGGVTHICSSPSKDDSLSDLCITSTSSKGLGYHQRDTHEWLYSYLYDNVDAENTLAIVELSKRGIYL